MNIIKKMILFLVLMSYVIIVYIGVQEIENPKYIEDFWSLRFSFLLYIIIPFTIINIYLKSAS